MKEKKLKRHDPFGNCLEQAIKDEANPVLGMTPAKKDLFLRMAGMVETQADRPDWDFYTATDIRFGRLSREERVAYLDEHRKALLDGPEVLFFDTELHYLDRDLDRKEKLAQAIGINVKPTPELLATWQECDHNAREFVQQIPYLKQMLDGLIAVLKLEFLERELKCYNTPFSPEQIERLQAIEIVDAQTDETRTFTMEEISRMGLITLTYEDWLSGRPGHYSAGDLFEVMQHTDGGLTTLRVHELTHSEFQKIQAKKREILEGYVSAYTTAFISDFERRYSKSKEKKVLVQNELELLQQLLFNPKSEAIYSVYTDTLWLSFRNDRSTDETVCHWYKRICVDGEDAMGAIAPIHANVEAKSLSDSGSTKYVVAALAFQRFKSYLERRALEILSTSKQLPEPTFEQLFVEGKMDAALSLAIKWGLINEDLTWRYKKKERPLAALWHEWINLGFVRGTIVSNSQALQIIALEFGLKKPGKNVSNKFTGKELEAEVKRLSERL